MTITESDRKLLGYLAAFLIAVLFIFCVFRPLSEKLSKLEQDTESAREQALILDSQAAQAQDMSDKEESTRQQTSQVLARFYPMLESQEAESMATVLMLNHHLSIQSLSIAMSETDNQLSWYQYSEETLHQSEEAQDEEAVFGLYTARVTCTAEGSRQDLWNFIDDISENYPAISIVSVEWPGTETSAVGVKSTEAEGSEEESSEAESVETESAAAENAGAVNTEAVEEITICLEIFMCNQ